MADEIVYLLAHVTVCGHEKDGREVVVGVMKRGGFLEEVSARAGAHDSNWMFRAPPLQR